MRYFLVTFAILCFSIQLSVAQHFSEKDSSSVNLSLNFSNVGLSNWVAGGENSVSLGGVLDIFWHKEAKKSSWTTTANYAYGLARVGHQDNLFKKTDDQLTINSHYGYKLAPKNWRAALAMNFRTQSTNGYNYEADSLGIERRTEQISGFFLPRLICFLPQVSNTTTKSCRLIYRLWPLSLPLCSTTRCRRQGLLGLPPTNESEQKWAEILP